MTEIFFLEAVGGLLESAGLEPAPQRVGVVAFQHDR